MIKEAIASFERNRNAGFTLMEMIVVLAIVSAVSMLTIPPMLSYIEAARRQVCIAEAETVCSAVSIYIAQENLNGTVSAWDLYEDLIFSGSIDSRQNPINGMLSMHSSDGRIVSVIYDESRRSFEGIIYEVGGYKITVKPGYETKVVKI